MAGTSVAPATRLAVVVTDLIFSMRKPVKSFILFLLVEGLIPGFPMSHGILLGTGWRIRLRPMDLEVLIPGA